MATLFIENKPYEVKSGKHLLETCLSLGFNLPYFCWHPALGSVGACRQCAVKLFKDENDTRGRLIMSCMEPVTDKQRISIEDPEAKAFRENVIEWLMTNHPHDCAVCDEGGSCHLQDMTVMTGHAYRRFQYKKRTYRNQYLGPFLNHEMNRCIQCYRCVRFYRDYAGGHDLEAFASKNHVYFGRHQDGVLENEFSGNLAEVCPTGVFTDKTLKEHYTRKWDLTMAPSICHHCSLGCNTIAGERYGELRVIMNRFHGDVNGYFLCDRGRFGYQFVNSRERVVTPRINNTEGDEHTLFTALETILQPGARIIGIGSPRASLQSNFVLKTLVGAHHFYHGVSDDEHHLAQLTLNILRDGPVAVATINDVEHADAVLVLGEDLTNTAPRLALAIRQVGKQYHLPQVKASGIPEWHDAAVREIIQDKKAPVFITSVNATKLDEIAQGTYRGAPESIARLGFAIASLLDSSAAKPEGLTIEEMAIAQQIVEALDAAQRPVIISGTSNSNEAILKASANIAWALHRKNSNTKIALTLPECNSMGLAMMGGHRISSAFDAVLNDHADTAIIIENDLYRHGRKEIVDEFIHKCKTVIVIDHLDNRTVRNATIVVPAGTFAESDGTIVNNEGRAQRFFQVYEPKNVLQESWRWLLAFGKIARHTAIQQWNNFEDVTKAISTHEPKLAGIDQVTPSSEFRIAGQRIPREPHRCSGRTSMNANKNVSEPKPPEDTDSPLSYTMEGFRGQAPSPMIPFFWAPGWNSVQSVNKYQEEVGTALRGGNPGLRLLTPLEGQLVKYFTAIPEHYKPLAGHLWIVPIHHIFGSEELSARSEPITARSPAPYILLSHDEAQRLTVNEGELLSFEIEGQHYSIPVKCSAAIPPGLGALPQGLTHLPYVDLPAWGLVKQTSVIDKKILTPQV